MYRAWSVKAHGGASLVLCFAVLVFQDRCVSADPLGHAYAVSRKFEVCGLALFSSPWYEEERERMQMRRDGMRKKKTRAKERSSPSAGPPEPVGNPFHISQSDWNGPPKKEIGQRSRQKFIRTCSTTGSRDFRACFVPKSSLFFIPVRPFFIIVAFHRHSCFCLATLFSLSHFLELDRKVVCMRARAGGETQTVVGPDLRCVSITSQDKSSIRYKASMRYFQMNWQKREC